jgi:hypothetical protein
MQQFNSESASLNLGDLAIQYVSDKHRTAGSEEKKKKEKNLLSRLVVELSVKSNRSSRLSSSRRLERRIVPSVSGSNRLFQSQRSSINLSHHLSSTRVVSRFKHVSDSTSKRNRQEQKSHSQLGALVLGAQHIFQRRGV